MSFRLYYQRAETEYSKALDSEPNFTAARFGLATLYWDSRQLDKALPALASVLQSVPEDPEANYMVAEILVERHQFEEALPYLRKALNGRPETVPKTHVMLSKVYAAQGLTTAAIAELQQALHADSDGTYHYQMAQLYEKIGDTGAASKALEESEELRRKKDRR